MSITALVILGVYHGVNPGMGWLFAVARGMQARSRAEVVRSLIPLGVGHEASIALVAVVYELGATVVATRVLSLVAAIVLVSVGVTLLVRRRHMRWVGMNLRPHQLALWAFLMSSAEGAGLMLVPVLRGQKVGAPDELAGLHGHSLGANLLHGAWAAGIHGATTITTMGIVALVVYGVIGLAFLRRVWVNLDRIWAGALIAAGVVTLFG